MIFIQVFTGGDLSVGNLRPVAVKQWLYLLFNLDIIWDIAHMSGHLGWMDHWKAQLRVTIEGSIHSDGTWWCTEAFKNPRKHSRTLWVTFPSHLRRHSLNQTFPQTVKARFPFNSFLASLTNKNNHIRIILTQILSILSLTPLWVLFSKCAQRCTKVHKEKIRKRIFRRNGNSSWQFLKLMRTYPRSNPGRPIHVTAGEQVTKSLFK